MRPAEVTHFAPEDDYWAIHGNPTGRDNYYIKDHMRTLLRDGYITNVRRSPEGYWYVQLPDGREAALGLKAATLQWCAGFEEALWQLAKRPHTK